MTTPEERIIAAGRTDDFVSWGRRLRERHPKFRSGCSEETLNSMVSRWEAFPEYYPCEEGDCWHNAMLGSRFCEACSEIQGVPMLCACRDCPREAPVGRLFCESCKLRFHDASDVVGASEWLSTRDARFVSDAVCPVDGCTSLRLPNTQRCWSHRGYAQDTCILRACGGELDSGGVMCVPHGSAFDSWQRQHPQLSNAAAFVVWLRAIAWEPRASYTCQRHGCTRERFEETVDGELWISASCLQHVCGNPYCVLAALSDEITLCSHHYEISQRAIAAQSAPVATAILAREEMEEMLQTGLREFLNARFAGVMLTSASRARLQEEVGGFLRNLGAPVEEVELTAEVPTCVSGQCSEHRRPGGALCPKHFAEIQKR